jgi:hypothetical protein
MEEDRYTRITLRLPKELHARLEAAAAATSKSLNAEIVGRLEASTLQAPVGYVPYLVTGDHFVSRDLQRRRKQLRFDATTLTTNLFQLQTLRDAWMEKNRAAGRERTLSNGAWIDRQTKRLGDETGQLNAAIVVAEALLNDIWAQIAAVEKQLEKQPPVSPSDPV